MSFGSQGIALVHTLDNYTIKPLFNLSRNEITAVYFELLCTLTRMRQRLWEDFIFGGLNNNIIVR